MVFIASIGVPHLQSLIYRNDLEERFDNVGLDLVSWLPFETLNIMFKNDLTKEEIEVSSMYAAAVFQKRKKHRCSLMKFTQNSSLISFILPISVEEEILHFLSIPDLLTCRHLSSLWRNGVDQLDISSHVKEDYFVRNDTFFDEDNCIKTIHLSPRSMALYIHMGGTVHATSTLF